MKKYNKKISYFIAFFKYSFINRILPITLCSSILVIFLFYIMAKLVFKDRIVQLHKDKNELIEFSMNQQESQLQTKKRQNPKKQQQEKPPSFEKIKPLKTQFSPTNLNVNINNLIEKLNVLDGEMGGVGVIPIFRISPLYPRSARMRKIEGWVRVRFDISKKGTVTNIKILGATPPRVFENAAVSAVRKWKYKPKKENNQYVVQQNIEIQLDFELKK